MRMLPLLFAAAVLAACSNDDKWAKNVETPELDQMAEAPGDWTALDGMIGRTPAESGLIESSPVSVDLNARLGAMAKPYRDAMMAAGPLTRQGNYLVARAAGAWLVIDPAGHAFRAGMGEQEWTTAGADVPRPD